MPIITLLFVYRSRSPRYQERKKERSKERLIHRPIYHAYLGGYLEKTKIPRNQNKKNAFVVFLPVYRLMGE